MGLTYGDIINTVAAQVHRSDLETKIMRWLRLTHISIQKGKYFRFQERTWVSEPLKKDYFHWTLPDNFLKEHHIYFTDIDYNIECEIYKSDAPYFFKEKYIDDNKRYQYRVWSDSIYILPALEEDDTKRLMIDGYRLLTLPSSTTNFKAYEDYISKNHPNLLIWGSLMYSHFWYLEEERAKLWKVFYDEAWNAYLQEEIHIVSTNPHPTEIQ